jgi:two-component system, cell cycle sensor histidine kinase and response regulator CckA
MNVAGGHPMPERQKILIVDDKEENLFTLEKILRETGGEAVKATSGNEALAATLHHDFALAILDVHMPGMSGFELADHLRSDQKTRSLPIIFLTATFADEENAFKGYEAGAVDYIIKPYNPVILNGKVAAFLELARYRSQLEALVQERTQRIQHINRVLRKIRSVNQLIVREEDESRLIRNTCKLLVEARGFDGAWITLIDSAQNPVEIAHDGFGEGFAGFTHILESGDFPPCCEEALRRQEVIVRDNEHACSMDCPLSTSNCSGRAMVTVLEHEGIVRGFMGIALPAAMAADEEEQSLFREVAGDISYALHNMQIAKERQTIFQALRNSEERRRLALDAAKAGTWEWDLRTNENFWCDELWALFRLEPHSCQASYQTWLKTVHPDDRAEVERAVREAASNGTELRVEWRTDGSSGGERWLMSRGQPISDGTGQLTRYIGIVMDITDRKNIESALRNSEQKYRAVFNVASVGIDMVDRKGKFLEVNSALSSFLGYSPEELQHLTVLDVTHPDDKTRSRELHDDVIHGTKSVYRQEKRYLRKDGEVRWADTAVSAVREADGAYRATVGVITDITERKKSEQAQQRLTAAVEQAAETVVITDEEGTILYVNPAFEKTTGYSREEAVGNNPRILKSGRHDHEFYERMWKTLTGGNTWTGHIVNKKKDGTLFEEDVSISPIRDNSGKTVNFVAVKRDVTKEMVLQEQLFQAQKMESIGTLAGGVAHDFNNILQVALGYSEMMLGEEGLADRYRADVKKINQSAQRGADLVKRLLTFSRKTDITPQPLNLNQRVKDMRKMIERTIPKMIEIQLLLNENIARVNADSTQIDQILMNLSVNARDAMPEGGKLTFETEDAVLDEEFARINIGVTPGQYVLLTVTDSGTGMDKDTLQHVFEPFYTTKAVGEGTGLGLAMVHGIVKQHGGHIGCYSERGKGTTFKIYFPALVSEEEEAQTIERQMPRGGSETILLVDDEEFIRDLGSRILEKAGYTVITAANGKEALDVYEGRSSEIALILLDLMMPEMGGKQCLEGLLSLNPSVKVIIASGFTANGPTKDALEAGAKALVNKPYDMRQVREIVRQVLDTE